MKRKFLQLLAGMAAIAIVAAPVMAIAESPILIAQQNTQFSNPFGQIGLSDSQRKKIQAIWDIASDDIFAVVTSEQKKRFLEARNNGKTLQEAREDMELNEAQKKKIRQILKAANQRSLDVLTPEQIQKLQDLYKQQTQQ